MTLPCVHGKVKSLRLLDPYIPGQTKYSKGSILDILTETDCHVLINVEMQADDFRTYNDRDLLYAGKVLSTYALQSGSDYDKMKKTVMIAVSHHELKLCDSCMGPSTAHRLAGIGLQP